MVKDQGKTPFLTKLLEYANSDVVSHDVPGHKLGNIGNDLETIIGKETFRLDANAPRGLDNLSRPMTVLKEASELMADAFDAEQCYFLTGGTTLGILAMIMSTVRAKEKIILPRNVHKSAINALILSGAVPIFVQPHIDPKLGIANHLEINAVKKAIKDNPDAKGVLVINPTYFGAISDLSEIVEVAHEYDMVVMCDEAHGSHLGFSDRLPLSAMQAGADLTSCSLHKTLGSLTQSSILLVNSENVDHLRLRSTINMLQSTSPSSLLMASLDASRKTFATQGEERLSKLIDMANDTRDRINKIPNLEALDKAYFLKQGSFGYDETKLIIKVSKLGINGFEAYRELADIHHVQMELAETHLILAVLSIGTSQKDLDALVDALQMISDKYNEQDLPAVKPKVRYAFPEVFTRPREAYHAPKKYIPLTEAAGEIAGESVMIYPPGIPIVIPGEVISEDIINDLGFYRKNGSTILSDTESGFIKVIDKNEWVKWEKIYEDE